MIKKKALTTYEIAKYIDVAPRTVVQWVNEGKIKAYRTPGSHFRIKIEDFVLFLEDYQIPIPQGLETVNQEDQRKKILIVDDDKNMTLSIQRILKLEDRYELDLAYNGFDAGRKVVMMIPDLVILDIKMPGLNGYEVAKRIRETKELKDTKILAISAFFEEEGKEKIFACGANACLDKPFDAAELHELINQLIGD